MSVIGRPQKNSQSWTSNSPMTAAEVTRSAVTRSLIHGGRIARLCSQGQETPPVDNPDHRPIYWATPLRGFQVGQRAARSFSERWPAVPLWPSLSRFKAIDARMVSGRGSHESAASSNFAPMED